MAVVWKRVSRDQLKPALSVTKPPAANPSSYCHDAALSASYSQRGSQYRETVGACILAQEWPLVAPPH